MQETVNAALGVAILAFIMAGILWYWAVSVKEELSWLRQDNRQITGELHRLRNEMRTKDRELLALLQNSESGMQELIKRSVGE